MINIGIDVGKFKHCASVLDNKTGEVLIKPFFFTNDQEGFEFFYSKVKRYIHRKHAVGMEDTGHYMINLTNYLLEKNLSVKYINPRTTAMRRKELGMSAKNDRKDSLQSRNDINFQLLIQIIGLVPEDFIIGVATK